MTETFETPATLRAFLQGQYGRPDAEGMIPRERVEMALRHQQPDRVPFDFWGVPEVYDLLRDRLGVECDEEVLRLMGVDCRMVAPDYVGPAPRVQPDGTYYDAWGTHRRSISNDFSTYDEYASHPLSAAQSVADVETWDGWAQTEHWDVSVETWDGWAQTEHWDVSNLQTKIRALQQDTQYHIRYEVGGIFEWSWALRGMEQFLMDLVLQPEIPCAIMDCFTDIYIANVTRVLQAADGLIDMVYTYDDVGIQQGLLLSERMWRQSILPRHQRLNQAIRHFPTRIMFHSCGAVYPLISSFADDMGIDVLNPLQPRAAGMDLERIKKEFGERLSFHGAVDIQHTLPYGTPEEVEAEVRHRCRLLGRDGGYICAPAHYLQADTPLRNIIALYTAPREI